MARNVNDNPNPEYTFSQKKAILSYLQEGGSLTPLEAEKKFGTSKLATRISELINEDGHTEIQKRKVKVLSPFGRKMKTVMMYYIHPQIEF